MQPRKRLPRRREARLPDRGRPDRPVWRASPSATQGCTNHPSSRRQTATLFRRWTVASRSAWRADTGSRRHQVKRGFAARPGLGVEIDETALNKWTVAPW